MPNFVQPCWCSGKRCNAKHNHLSAVWESLHSWWAASLAFQGVGIHVLPCGLKTRRIKGTVEHAEGRLHLQDPRKSTESLGTFGKQRQMGRPLHHQRKGLQLSRSRSKTCNLDLRARGTGVKSQRHWVERARVGRATRDPRTTFLLSV